MNKKIRSDAKLKNLPEERKELIAEFAADHSLADTLAWLKEDGVTTSAGALSEFLSDFRQRQKFQLFEQNSLTLIELLRQKRPEMPETERDKWASDYFQLQAINQDDPKTYLAFTKLRIKEEELTLAKKKFHRETCDLFLQWAEDQRAKEVSSSNATHTEKIERLGQLMFGEDWED